jgi:hypothetical protein
MTNYIASIAQEIFEELGEPSDFSISAIAAWLRRNIGGLGNFLNESFSINDQGLEISPALNDVQKYIFKKMYNVYYFDLKIKSVGSLATTDFITIKDDIGSVQKVNKNEVLKNYISIRKQEYDELKGLVYQYRNNESSPVQVAGDDTIPGFYGDFRFDFDGPGFRTRRNNFIP